MVTILAYENGEITYEDFQSFLWGSGQMLINEIGEEMFVFYLLADENEYYKK